MRGGVLMPAYYEIVTDYERRFHEKELQAEDGGL